MSVYKPKKSQLWHYDFQFKGQRYHGSTGCPAKRDAEAYERRRRAEVANPAPARAPITLDDACGLRCELVEGGPSWPTERYIMKALVKGLGGKTMLRDISQRDLQVYYAKRRADRSNASVNREIDTARAVWSKAEKARYDTGEAPDWSDLYLKVNTAPPRELAQDGEEDQLFDAIAPDAYDVVMFALISGWRKAEIIGLRWSDLDLTRAEARTRIKGGDTVVRPLNAALVALIANQPKAGPFVFTYVCRRSRAARRKGQRYPMTVTALRLRWEEAREAAKLTKFRFHDLRHTAATRILRATQNLATTQKVLRHTNIKTTLRYAHVLDDDIRHALDVGQSRNITGPGATQKRKA